MLSFYVSYDYNVKCWKCVSSGHPEKPERISNIFACCADYGVLERCLRLEGRSATEEELLLVHTEDHINHMKQTQTMSNKELYRLKESLNSVYFHSTTYEAALYAAGSVLEVRNLKSLVYFSRKNNDIIILL